VTETLVDRRRRLVRADIGRIALDLFAERGFEAVTVEDIADAAGTSPRTFFRYFATKDEVVLDYERHLYDRLVAALDARPATEGPVTALREAYRVTSHVEPDDRARVVQRGRILDAAPALQARAQGARLADSRTLIEHVARRMGVATDDVRPRTVVAAMSAVASAEFRAWVAGGGRGDPADRIVSALALVEQGLAAVDRKHRSRRANR